jgi:autotransporter-associated beta strand protein
VVHDLSGLELAGNGTAGTNYVRTFTIVYQPPAATADSYTATQGSTLTVAAPGVLANDTDPQGYPLTATLVSSPSNGTLSLNSNGSFTYTPNSGYLGPDSFTYEATDGYGSSSPTTVSLIIGPATLTWDGVPSGNWTDAQWSGGNLPYPNNTANAVVSTASVVDVTYKQAANSLEISDGGYVGIAAGASLSVTTDTSVTGGGTLNVDPNGAFSTSGILTLDSGGSLTAGPISAAAYQLNDGTVSANLSGLGGLTKGTDGTVILSGSNSYAGGTVVDDGTLIATNANALPNSTSLTIGAGGIFVFDPSQSASRISAAALGSPARDTAAAPETSAPIVTASILTNTSATAFAISTPSSVISATPDGLAGTPVAQATSATTTAGAHVQQVLAVAVLFSTHFRTGTVARAASAFLAKDRPSVITPAAKSSVASDAVFKLYRSPIGRTVAPADNAQSARPWAWLAATESFWSSSDQNQKTASTVEALDKVLARFGR